MIGLEYVYNMSKSPLFRVRLPMVNSVTVFGKTPAKNRMEHGVVLTTPECPKVKAR